jgi:asparagine synthase (glutamine-hydrolysing)
MCGLAGLYDIKGLRPFAPGLLEHMTEVIAHRGPDGAGHYLEPGLALGHRRLAIIDLGGGAQPMRTEDGRLTVVFNGEIYNFQELRAELAAKGARFRTRSDTEVLLHGWRVWGEALLPRLNGMFAFALWDAEAQTLALARDRFGKKPLHYAFDDHGALVFGSEIKSLLCAPGVDTSLDRTAVADFFAYGYVPDPKTIYRAIRKLPPAHVMIARRGAQPQLRAYWSLLDAAAAASEADPKLLIDRLGEAVRRRLIADVPLGALLSGGVDSSAVVALMADAGGRARTFSIGFSESDYDESAHARLVAERYGANHATRQVSADDFSLLPRLAQIYDEPFGDVSAIPTFAVCALARTAVTVALTGDGGDEALAGYRRYRFHMAQARARAWLPPALRGRPLAAVADAWPTAPWVPRPLRAATTLRELALDPASAYARMAQALPEEVRDGLFSADLRRQLAGYDPGEIVRRPFQADAPLDPLKRAQYADAMTYLPGDILTKVDRASMANSLELRAPMLDPEFFVWSFGLPPGAKLSAARGGKALLKQGLQPRLPESILYRRKQGFTVPVARWFRGPLRDEVLDLAASPALRADGALDLGAVRRLAQAHVDGRADNAKPLWLAWVYNGFLTKPAPKPLRAHAARARPQPMPAQP